MNRISTLTAENTAGVVEPVINDSAYDIVKIVSDNIGFVITTATGIENINILAPIANDISIV